MCSTLKKVEEVKFACVYAHRNRHMRPDTQTVSPQNSHILLFDEFHTILIKIVTT